MKLFSLHSNLMKHILQLQRDHNSNTYSGVQSCNIGVQAGSGGLQARRFEPRPNLHSMTCTQDLIQKQVFNLTSQPHEKRPTSLWRHSADDTHSEGDPCLLS